MRSRLIYLIIIAFTLTSCDFYVDYDDPDNPYDEYYGRMIERIRVDDHNSHQSDYVYYDHDRRGRITTIEDTYYQAIDRFTYGTNKYGDDIITVNNNLGEDRDIFIDWDGYAQEEVAYDKIGAYQSIVYDYMSGKLCSVNVERYTNSGSIFSEESYDLDYDYHDNLRSINRFYEEGNYFIDSELIFSSFSRYENYYNIDILSILGLYINDDFASHIGRTGARSRYLPTSVALRTNRNGRYDKDVYYNINYIGNKGLISAIEVSSSLGMRKKYYISFVN